MSATLFDHIDALYHHIEDDYAALESAAVAAGNGVEKALYAEMRKLNDQAYFLFLFTRLEGHIRTVSEELIEHKLTTAANDQDRWPWKLVKDLSKVERLPFMERVALITTKGGTNYNKISEFYSHRNSIGHGGSFKGGVSEPLIPDVILDIRNLFAAIKYP